jgi:hypothetical protein
MRSALGWQIHIQFALFCGAVARILSRNQTREMLLITGNGPPRNGRLRDHLKPIHIHHPHIGDLQMRNHRQAQERQLQKGFLQHHPQ